MGVDWQRMDCPSCGEGLQCVLCGADVRRFDDGAAERGAEAVEREMDRRSGGDAFLYEMDDDARDEFLRAVAGAVLRAADGR